VRFVADGPSIPDELLVARDEGRVVFFCGADAAMTVFGRRLALSLSLIVGASALVLAQEPSQADRGGAVLPQTSATSSPTGDTAGSQTGKERLGRKWMDEQRLDNCNVPPDKRGSKPRPDACPSAATQ
jgi:hypothetical protein